MSLLSYPAKFTTGSDGCVLVEFVDLPRTATEGRNEREAMKKPWMRLGPISSMPPVASAGDPNTNTLARAAEAGAQPALHTAMRDQHVRNSGLARRLGPYERAIRRMLPSGHAARAGKVRAFSQRT